jgi:hypothetical protein
MFSVDGPIVYVVLVLYNTHRKFRKRMDTVIAFIHMEIIVKETNSSPLCIY